jgi:hypothetical protein
MADETGVTCNYCGGPTELVTGEKLYPMAGEVHQRRYYHCATCNAWVGTHEGTTIPQGTLANAMLRSWRGRALKEFDPLWKAKTEGKAKLDPHTARVTAYAWLAVRLDVSLAECHIARFDEEKCRRVIEICEPHRKAIKKTQQEIAQRELAKAAA